MITKIQKWGNSQGLRLSKTVLGEAGIEVGDAVDVTSQKGTLVLTPVRRVRGGHSLRELVGRILKGDRAREIDWGQPVGREVW